MQIIASNCMYVLRCMYVVLHRYVDRADATDVTRKNNIKRVHHRQRDPKALTSLIILFFYPTIASIECKGVRRTGSRQNEK